MAKLVLNHPTLFLLYGFPGAGKTYFARQLCDELHAAHLQDDRIRNELFEQPRYDQQENDIVSRLMEYMAEEFLQAGLSVVLDVNAARANQRRKLRQLAARCKSHTVLVWFQLETESAFARVAKRDRRKADDKYTVPLKREAFEALIAGMQNPSSAEDYMVVSGKRTFHTQRSAVIKKLYDMGLLQADQATAGIAKPALVNLVPSPIGGRVDPSRRNIVIR